MRKEDETAGFTKIKGTHQADSGPDADAPYLAAMAHFGQSVIPTIALVRDHIVAITTMIKVTQKRQEAVPDAVVWNLEAVDQVLRDVQTQFKAEFLRVLKARGASMGP